MKATTNQWICNPELLIVITVGSWQEFRVYVGYGYGVAEIFREGGTDKVGDIDQGC